LIIQGPKLPGVSDETPKSGSRSDDSGVADAVRAAVERTLQATAPAASQTKRRAVDLLDEVSRVRRQAGAEISRRSQEAGAGLSRRGQEAGAELSKRGQEAGLELTRIGQEAASELKDRLELLERRLASLESGLKGEEKAETKPKAEG
jgi:hypothetical protein